MMRQLPLYQSSHWELFWPHYDKTLAQKALDQVEK